MRKFIPITLLLLSYIAYPQGPQAPQPPQASLKITGTVLDQETKEPLEYATLVLQSVENPDKITGGITDANGKFEVEAIRGNYNLSVEYISYKSYTVDNFQLKSDTNLGVINLSLDVSQLAEAEVVGVRPTVE